MLTLALIARKGGVGKTTLAAHIAVAASASLDTVLVDLDPQKSLTAWWNDRTAETPILSSVEPGKLSSEIANVQDSEGLIVIDTAAVANQVSAAALNVADLVLIPVRPSPHDLRGVWATVEEVRKAGKPFLFAVTQAVANATLTSQAVANLTAIGPVLPTVMHSRVIYAGAMTDGLTVQEVDGSSRAAQEIISITDDVLTHMRHIVKSSNRKRGKA